jgi:hypothetical protein
MTRLFGNIQSVSPALYVKRNEMKSTLKRLNSFER